MVTLVTGSVTGRPWRAIRSRFGRKGLGQGDVHAEVSRACSIGHLAGHHTGVGHGRGPSRAVGSHIAPPYQDVRAAHRDHATGGKPERRAGCGSAAARIDPRTVNRIQGTVSKPPTAVFSRVQIAVIGERQDEWAGHVEQLARCVEPLQTR